MALLICATPEDCSREAAATSCTSSAVILMDGTSSSRSLPEFSATLTLSVASGLIARALRQGRRRRCHLLRRNRNGACSALYIDDDFLQLFQERVERDAHLPDFVSGIHCHALSQVAAA